MLFHVQASFGYGQQDRDLGRGIVVKRRAGKQNGQEVGRVKILISKYCSVYFSDFQRDHTCGWSHGMRVVFLLRATRWRGQII